jgi:hypothetical protein
MGNHVLPIEADMVMPWKAARPNVRDKMLARGAEIDSPTYASRVYPDLFVDKQGRPGSVPAARFALASRPIAGATRIDAMRNLIGIAARNTTVTAEFRPVGVGMSMSNVRLPAWRGLNDFRFEMQRIFGCEVVVELHDAPLWAPGTAGNGDWRALHFGPGWRDMAPPADDFDAAHVPRGPPDG